jgi:hypothetical protein
VIVRHNSSIHGPVFPVVLFILIIFLLIILLYGLNALIQHFVIDRPDPFDNLTLDNFSLAINTYNVLLQLKSVDNNKASFLLNFQTLMKPINDKLVDLIQKYKSAIQGSLLFLFLLMIVSIRLQTYVDVFYLHHNTLLHFSQLLIILGLLSFELMQGSF